METSYTFYTQKNGEHLGAGNFTVEGQPDSSEDGAFTLNNENLKSFSYRENATGNEIVKGTNGRFFYFKFKPEERFLFAAYNHVTYFKITAGEKHDTSPVSVDKHEFKHDSFDATEITISFPVEEDTPAAAARREVVISDIFYEGEVPVVESDEYVKVSNQRQVAADLSGWLINAGDSKQNFKFPAGTVLEAGQSYLVYTNEVHPETGGFSFGSIRAVWNNKGDTGTLFNAEGELVDEYKYGDHAS